MVKSTPKRVVQLRKKQKHGIDRSTTIFQLEGKTWFLLGVLIVSILTVVLLAIILSQQ